ncbi:MAG: hypothetical protein ABSE22_13835 [Xanthobacteraceae bacterium]|jgi:hypothetical protein
MASASTAKAPIRERITTELKEFVVIAIYLGICFTALAYLKAAILQAHDIAFAPFGFAAAKALICAKFVLVGRMFGLGERFKSLPLIWPTLHKSFAFLILLLVLNAIEEIVVGVIHHRTIADSIAGIGGGTLDQLMATSVVALLILIPFFAFRALGEVVGEENLVRVFFYQRHTVDKA